MVKIKYIEGQFYELIYLKKVFIDEEYLVFEDANKERFVIPSIHYRHFQLQPQQKVKCLITRVDCKGKISFEPEHPYYKIGEIYEFDFVRMQVIKEKELDPLSGQTKNKKQYEIIVSDREGFEHSVQPHNWQMKRLYKAKTIKCRLIKIVKGHFQLINLEEEKSFGRKILDKISSSIKHKE